MFRINTISPISLNGWQHTGAGSSNAKGANINSLDGGALTPSAVEATSNTSTIDKLSNRTLNRQNTNLLASVNDRPLNGIEAISRQPTTTDLLRNSSSIFDRLA